MKNMTGVKTSAEIRTAIKAEYMANPSVSIKSIAKKYGLTQETVSHIIDEAYADYAKEKILKEIWRRWRRIQPLNVGGISASHCKHQSKIANPASGGLIFPRSSTSIN